ncbi:hypothetical protein EMIT091MI3_280011 [Kosakonia quasisacchari]
MRSEAFRDFLRKPPRRIRIALHRAVELTARSGQTWETKVCCVREADIYNIVAAISDNDGYPVQVVGKFHRLNAPTLTIETLPLPEVAIPNSIFFSLEAARCITVTRCRVAYAAAIIPH